MKFKDLVCEEEFDKLEKEFDEIMGKELPILDNLLENNEFDKLQKELEELNFDDLDTR